MKYIIASILAIITPISIINECVLNNRNNLIQVKYEELNNKNVVKQEKYHIISDKQEEKEQQENIVKEELQVNSFIEEEQEIVKQEVSENIVEFEKDKNTKQFEIFPEQVEFKKRTDLSGNKNVKSPKIILIDKSEGQACAQAIEVFYEDDNYQYYFTCLKSQNMFVLINGKEYKLVDALNNGIVTMNQLNENGYSFLKKAKLTFKK